MTGADAIARLERLFAERTGIDLGRGLKRPQLERFAVARAAALGLSSTADYVDRLYEARSPELARLIDVATVGLTWFFRDPEQLAAVAQVMRQSAAMRPLEIWVAGCATGEEVYSLAMIAAACERPANILGTDINSEHLAHAERGVYGAWSCRNVPAEHVHRLWAGDDGRFTVARGLRTSLRFVRHNLMDPPPMPQQAGRGWDLVLCRNVLYYFQPQQATRAVEQMAGALAPDGWLFLGANEILQCDVRVLQMVEVGGRHALRRCTVPRPPVAPIIVPTPRLPPPAPLPPVAAPVAPPAPDASALLRRANDRHAAGQLAEALQLYAQVLAQDPLSAEARMFHGITEYKLGDVATAVGALRAALYLDSELWPAAFYLALAYDQLGSPDQAVREYRRVVSSAGRRLDGVGGLIAQLEAWKDDVVGLARKRISGKAAP
jgi:chemotaxis protein methyltransferase CheR